jgi:hypothetical protein
MTKFTEKFTEAYFFLATQPNHNRVRNTIIARMYADQDQMSLEQVIANLTPEQKAYIAKVSGN